MAKIDLSELGLGVINITNSAPIQKAYGARLRVTYKDGSVRKFVGKNRIEANKRWAEFEDKNPAHRDVESYEWETS